MTRSIVSMLLALGLLHLAGCPRGSYSGSRSGGTEVPLATLQPRSLEVLLEKQFLCMGHSMRLVTAVKLEDREILAANSYQVPRDPYPAALHSRIAAATASNDYVDIEELEVRVRGPASYQGGNLVISREIDQALDGPVRVTVSSPHHPDLAPAEATIGVRLDCNYTFDREGERGDRGQTGQDGSRGNPDGGSGGPGGTGGDGGRGPALEVRAVPFAAPGGAWIQVVARDTTANLERRYILPPGARLTVISRGGKGGEGGEGGEGGYGTDEDEYTRAGDGGPGGAGGVGGRGGPGGVIRFVVAPELENRLESFLAWAAPGGDGGDGGRAGRGGGNGNYYLDGSARHESVEGTDGAGGAGGPPGPDGEVTVTPQRLGQLFSVDVAKLTATVQGMSGAPEDAAEQTADASGGRRPGGGTSNRPPPPTPAGGTSNRPPPPTTPGGGGRSAPEGSELASGRFTVAPLTLSRPDGRPLIAVARNGDITMGRAAVIGRIQGGAIVKDGQVQFALSRDGRLHARTRGGFQVVARIRPNGTVTFEGRPVELRLESGGRITRVNRGRRDTLETRFPGVPANARTTAAFLLYMAAGGLR